MAKSLNDIFAGVIQTNVDRENYVKSVLAKVKVPASQVRGKIWTCFNEGLTVDEAAQKIRRCE